LITLKKATKKELPIFDGFDKQVHAKNFVFRTGLSKHEAYFADSDITYLSIVDAAEKTIGYFILAQDPESDSIEFRRIVVDKDKLGIGQQAIQLMENYCCQNFNAKRIWLDAFEDNGRGIHIYKKLGYRFFKQKPYENRRLLFFEKELSK